MPALLALALLLAAPVPPRPSSYVDTDGANVRLGSTVLGAKLVLRSPALRVAILDMAGDGPYPAVAVRLETPETGAWVVGILLGRNGVAVPRLGRVIHAPGGDGPWLETSLQLPPGSPVLDASGRLLGVVVEERHGTSLAVPLQAVQAELRMAGTP